MDEAIVVENLQLAEVRVKADDEQVSRLAKLIADFEHHDMPDWADHARKLLIKFEGMRIQHRAERDWLKVEVTRMRA